MIGSWRRQRRRIEKAAEEAEKQAAQASDQVQAAERRHTSVRALVHEADAKREEWRSEIQLNHFTELLQAAMRSQ